MLAEMILCKFTINVEYNGWVLVSILLDVIR